MRRMTLVLLLFVVKLPMAAEEAASVTVHQAEWGDSRGEAPPPPGPAVPAKTDEPSPIFRNKGFRYGEGMRYGRGREYGQGMRYRPNTRFRGTRYASQGQFRFDNYYKGTGGRMRYGYRPNIQYGSGMPRLGANTRYGFNH